MSERIGFWSQAALRGLFIMGLSLALAAGLAPEAGATDITAVQIQVGSGTPDYADDGDDVLTGGQIDSAYSSIPDPLGDPLASNGGGSSGVITPGGLVTGDNLSTVTVTVSANVDGYSIVGGFSEDGDVAHKTVILNAATIGDEITVFSSYDYGYGAVVGGMTYASGEHATYNTVTVTNSTVHHGVQGGLAFHDGDASRNTVTITDSIINTATDTANLTGLGATGYVYGGHAFGQGYSGGIADNNTVVINATTNTATDILSVYGGASTGLGEAKGNTVEINGGTIGSVYGGAMDTTASSGNVSGNIVTINGGDITGTIFGGSIAGTGAVSGNKVNFYDGQAGSIVGGEADQGAAVSGNIVNFYNGVAATIIGGRSATGSLSNNQVYFSDGQATNIYGAESTDTASTNGITGSYVEISGGTVTGWVVGGVTNSASATVTGSTVKLANSPALSLTALRGGWKWGSGAWDSYGVGNTLILDHFVQGTGTIGNVGYFEFYEFYIASDYDTSEPILKANYLQGGNAAHPAKVTKLAIDGGGDLLAIGTELTLFQSANAIGGVWDYSSIEVSQGGIVDYGYAIDASSGTISLTLTNVSIPRAKPISEGFLGGLAMVLMGADLAAGPGLDRKSVV